MELRVVMRAQGALVIVGNVVDTIIDLVDTCGGCNFVGYPSFELGLMPEVLDGEGWMGSMMLSLSTIRRTEGTSGTTSAPTILLAPISSTSGQDWGCGNASHKLVPGR